MVCQNQSIDDSNADLARDLRVLVRERLKAGDTDEQVLDYVVDPEPLTFVDGHIERLTGPGLGVEIDEQAVRAADKRGHAWRGPVWRHADGSFAEW